MRATEAAQSGGVRITSGGKKIRRRGGKKKGKRSSGRKPEGETAPRNYECRKPVGSLREGNGGTSRTVKG